MPPNKQVRNPRIYLQQNVFDAALDRIRRLFDEFPNVTVSFSGGKDSTVVLELALIVARERKRLPLPVLWIDQEAEWNAVVEYVRSVMNRPEVTPYWFQGSFKLFNASTTSKDPWLHCWAEGEKWMRPKEPNSIHVNETGVDRFHKLFDGIIRWKYPDSPCANLGGVRCEESLVRANVLTNAATYKDITWGKVLSHPRQHYTFYPLYDWSYKDVWKAIHFNNWGYCKVYDYMYQHGVPAISMRVSNIHHETAIHVLKYLQDIEQDTWNKAVERIPSLNSVKQLSEAYSLPTKLPDMFSSWREYRDYLLANLITDEASRSLLAKNFATWEKRYHFDDPRFVNKFMRMCCSSILVNDTEGIKYGAFQATAATYSKKYQTKKKTFLPSMKGVKDD